MPTASIKDEGFWDNWPQMLAAYKAAVEAMDGGPQVAYFPMGDIAQNPPTVVALRLPPNAVLDRHAHNCDRFEIVVEGELHAEGKVLKPGDVMFTKPGVAYGPHTAGPDGVLTYEIFSNYVASYTAVLFPDGEDGEAKSYDLSNEGAVDELYTQLETPVERPPTTATNA